MAHLQGKLAAIGSLILTLRPHIVPDATRQGLLARGLCRGVYNYGDAGFYGSPVGVAPTRPIVGASSTPSGCSYWLVASDGGIFTHGDACDAGFYGSEGGAPLPAPVVATEAVP